MELGALSFGMLVDLDLVLESILETKLDCLLLGQ